MLKEKDRLKISMVSAIVAINFFLFFFIFLLWFFLQTLPNSTKRTNIQENKFSKIIYYTHQFYRLKLNFFFNTIIIIIIISGSNSSIIIIVAIVVGAIVVDVVAVVVVKRKKKKRNNNNQQTNKNEVPSKCKALNPKK